MVIDEETHIFLHQRHSIQLIENLVNEMSRGNQRKSRLAIPRNIMYPFIISRYVSPYHRNHKTVKPWLKALKKVKTREKVSCKQLLHEKKRDSCSKCIASKTPLPKLSTHVTAQARCPF